MADRRRRSLELTTRAAALAPNTDHPARPTDLKCTDGACNRTLIRLYPRKRKTPPSGISIEWDDNLEKVSIRCACGRKHVRNLNRLLDRHTRPARPGEQLTAVAYLARC